MIVTYKQEVLDTVPDSFTLDVTSASILFRTADIDARGEYSIELSYYLEDFPEVTSNV